MSSKIMKAGGKKDILSSVKTSKYLFKNIYQLTPIQYEGKHSQLDKRLRKEVRNLVVEQNVVRYTYCISSVNMNPSASV